MKVLITGSGGFVGKYLAQYLTENGHDVIKMVRERKNLQENEAFWKVETGEFFGVHIDKSTVIVNLAGANIAGQRWNASYKEIIRNSRIAPTAKMVQYLSTLETKPIAFISASAIGYYGNKPGEKLTEDSEPGYGFLAELAKEWEEATQTDNSSGMRVVNLRFGLVIDRNGGALGKMLLPFKLGMGGNIGSGTQYMSWISIVDVVRAIEYIMHKHSISGPVNMVSSQPVRNKDFTRILAEVLKRPAFLHVPEFVLKTMLGEMAEEMLLVNTEVIPVKLVQNGFIFYHKDLKTALEEILGNKYEL